MLSEDHITEFLQSRSFLPLTKKKYRSLLARYVCDVVPDPDTWEQGSVRWLEGLKVEPNTKRYYFDVLHSFLNWCLSRGYVPSNPMKLMKIRLSTMPLRYALTSEEVQKLVSVTRQKKDERALRDCAIIIFMLHTGLRVGGVSGLDVQDFIQVKPGRIIAKYKGKGHIGKDSFVVVPEIGVRGIDEYLKLRKSKLFASDQGAVFLTVWKDKCRLTESRMRETIRERMVEAKIKRPGICVHSLRHTAATMAYRSGADIMAIKEMLDHRSLETTQGYLHSIDRIEGAAELKIDYGLETRTDTKKRRK